MRKNRNPLKIESMILPSQKHLLLYFCIALLAGSSMSCSSGESKTASYRFIVAGHTYGAPKGDNTGLHPPFRDEFDYIKQLDNVEFGVFTGDIVRRNTRASWDRVDEDIESLGLPVYFAPGNHDRSSGKLYLKRYGVDGKSYHSFVHKGDLFVVLDPNASGWSITGNQLSFLSEALENAPDQGNIFVFVHQLIWWDEREEFRNLFPNSTLGREDQVNFWTQLVPVFTGLPNQVYFFAGDTGAFPKHLPSYFRYDNLNLIASGMGGGVNDNFLIVNRFAGDAGQVGVTVKWINKGTTETLKATRLKVAAPH